MVIIAGHVNNLARSEAAFVRSMEDTLIKLGRLDRHMMASFLFADSWAGSHRGRSS
jgi:hypothetical protein